MELLELKKLEDAYNLFQHDYPGIDFFDYLWQLHTDYKIRSYAPLRLVLKPSKSNSYTAKLWSITNPRYFFLKAAATHDYLNYRGLIRAAVKEAINFWGKEDNTALEYGLNTFTEEIETLRPITLKEFCKHNPSFDFKTNLDGEYKIEIINPRFSFTEHEEVELLGLKAKPTIIVKDKQDESRRGIRESDVRSTSGTMGARTGYDTNEHDQSGAIESSASKSEEIDWGAIEKESGIEI